MRKYILAFHFVGEVGQTVTLHVQVWRINLMNIAGKDHFCSLACTCNDGFHFMRGQILGFINDEESV